jgi:hypothetical protein
MLLRSLIAAAVFLLTIGMPSPSGAQTDTQVWTHFNFQWIKSPHVTMGVDVEPKLLVSAPAGEPGWATLDVTPSVEYTRGKWFDLVGDMVVGRTKQTDDLDSTEVTPRIGVRLHLLSKLRDQFIKERRPRHRLVIRDLLRLEWRHLHYSTDKPDSSSARLRNRLETFWPVNRQKISDDGATYLSCDWEWFIPIDDPDERFANRQRIRSGIGYRHSFAWRYEARYVWNRSRNTIDDPYTSTDHAFEFSMKRVW